MIIEHQFLRNADREISFTIVAIVVADLTAARFFSFDIEWASFVIPLTACVVLMCGGWFYRTIRPDIRLASALTATAQIVAFAAVGAPLSYLAAAAGLSLQDARFSAWDQYLGADWLGYLAFVSRHHQLHQILTIAYASFSVQTIATVLILGLSGQISRLGIFVKAFIATTLVTIAISALLPAEGPWLFHAVKTTAINGYTAPLSSTSWPAFFGLRAGIFTTLSGLNSEGIITFPSLHAALAVLFTMALWRTRGVKWILLVLNIAMILATPLEGSHYIVDVLAGMTIALLTWVAVTKQVSSRRRIAVFYLPQSPSIAPELNTVSSLISDSGKLELPEPEPVQP